MGRSLDFRLLVFIIDLDPLNMLQSLFVQVQHNIFELLQLYFLCCYWQLYNFIDVVGVTVAYRIVERQN